MTNERPPAQIPVEHEFRQRAQIFGLEMSTSRLADQEEKLWFWFKGPIVPGAKVRMTLSFAMEDSELVDVEQALRTADERWKGMVAAFWEWLAAQTCRVNIDTGLELPPEPRILTAG